MTEVISGTDLRSLEVQIVRSPKLKKLDSLEGFILNFVWKSFFTLTCCMLHLLFKISFSYLLKPFPKIFITFCSPLLKNISLTLSSKSRFSDIVTTLQVPLCLAGAQYL